MGGQGVRKIRDRLNPKKGSGRRREKKQGGMEKEMERVIKGDWGLKK